MLEQQLYDARSGLKVRCSNCSNNLELNSDLASTSSQLSNVCLSVCSTLRKCRVIFLYFFRTAATISGLGTHFITACLTLHAMAIRQVEKNIWVILHKRRRQEKIIIRIFWIQRHRCHWAAAATRLTAQWGIRIAQSIGCAEGAFCALTKWLGPREGEGSIILLKNNIFCLRLFEVEWNLRVNRFFSGQVLPQVPQSSGLPMPALSAYYAQRYPPHITPRITNTQRKYCGALVWCGLFIYRLFIDFLIEIIYSLTW